MTKTIQASPDQQLTVAALKGGNPVEFRKVLSAGFRGLITGEVLPKVETLDMDIERLNSWHDELDCAITIAAMLAGLTADTTSLLRSGKSTSDDRAEHVHNCSTQVLKIVKFVAENVRDCKLFDIVEVIFFLKLLFLKKYQNHSFRFQVFVGIATNELSNTTLDYTAQKQILEKVVQYGHPSNAVHVLFKARINSFWTKSFDETAIDDAEIQQLRHAADILPRVIKVADAARHVFNMNVQVHRERYNRLIQAAAEAVE